MKDSSKCTPDQTEIQKALGRKSFTNIDSSVKEEERDKSFIEDTKGRSTHTSEHKIFTPTAQFLPWTPHRRIILSLSNFTNKSLPFHLQA